MYRRIKFIMAAAVVMTAALMLSGCESLNSNLGNDDVSRKTTISLGKTAAFVDGKGARADGSVVTISQAGEYLIGGELNDGQLIVDIDRDEAVRLVLDGVTVHSEESVPLYIKKCGSCEIVLNEGSVNTFGDNARHRDTDEADKDSNAVLYCTGDLTIGGAGELNVTGADYHGIKVKGTLTLNSGSYEITAAEDAIHVSKDIAVNDGRYRIVAGDEAVSSDMSLTICAGSVDIRRSKKGLVATDIDISGGSIYVNSDENGIAPDSNLSVSGGNLFIEGIRNKGSDEAEKNGKVLISGGTLVLSGDAIADRYFADDSIQNVFVLDFGKKLKPGRTVEITTSAGNVIMKYSVSKKSRYSAVSCSSFMEGEEYTVQIDGKRIMSIGNK